MSIFGNIMSAIFGQSTAAAPGSGGVPSAGTTAPAADIAAPVPGGAKTTATGSAKPSAIPSSAPVPSTHSVDVAAIVDKAAAAKHKHEKLEWRTSIVDLMKALDIDSSLAARKELAKELGYTGDTNDSAGMNVWLHKQVMAKLAANGGKLPPEIKH